MRDLFNRHSPAGPALAVSCDEPRHQVGAADNRVAECDDNRLASCKVTGQSHGVGNPTGSALPRIEHAADPVGNRQIGRINVARLLKKPAEFEIGIEVVFDRRLLAAGYQQDLLDTGRTKLFNHVLHDRLPAYREHFLGLRLGCRKQSGSDPRNRNHGLAHGTKSGNGVHWLPTVRTTGDRTLAYADQRLGWPCVTHGVVRRSDVYSRYTVPVAQSTAAK